MYIIWKTFFKSPKARRTLWLLVSTFSFFLRSFYFIFCLRILHKVFFILYGYVNNFNIRNTVIYLFFLNQRPFKYAEVHLCKGTYNKSFTAIYNNSKKKFKKLNWGFFSCQNKMNKIEVVWAIFSLRKSLWNILTRFLLFLKTHCCFQYQQRVMKWTQETDHKM